VKEVWAEKLGGFTAVEIGEALKSCEEKEYPPNLPEFIGMCRTAARRRPSIEEPISATKQDIRRIESAVECITSTSSQYDYRRWCKELKRRYLAGEVLLPIQVQLASEAMGETWTAGECIP